MKEDSVRKILIVVLVWRETKGFIAQRKPDFTEDNQDQISG
jgi:hypothetical protein